MTKEEIKKQKWDVLNFLEENATLTVGECLVKFADQQTKELTEEVSKLENTIRVQGNVILKLTDDSYKHRTT